MQILPHDPTDVKLLVTLLYPDLEEYAQISCGQGIRPARVCGAGVYDPHLAKFYAHATGRPFIPFSQKAFLCCLYPYTIYQVETLFRLGFWDATSFGQPASKVWFDWLAEQNVVKPAGLRPSAFIMDSGAIFQEPAPAPPRPTTREAIPKPRTRSVGRTRKFSWIHPPFMELMEADRLPMNRIEVYRIILTYRQFPERTRERPAGRGPRHPYGYTTIHQGQISGYLEERRKDIMATARAARRRQAKRMGTSLRTVQYVIDHLCRLGYIMRVHPGLPKDCYWLSDEQKSRRIERHERHPQWGPQKYILATDRRQRGLLKTLNRKLKEAGLPPYLIYLKDLKP